MKNLPILIIFMSLLIAFSCSKDKLEAVVSDDAKATELRCIDPEPTPEYCGEIQDFDLYFGTCGHQTLAGKVSVSNDEDYLYVAYYANDPYTFGATHLEILCDRPEERGSPGLYSYNGYLVESVSTTTYRLYKVPFVELPEDCRECFYLLTHAEVGGETAYAGICVDPAGGSWFNYVYYCWQECNGNGHECEWVEETAWSAGARYVPRGNWATYTSYAGVEKTVTLFAGKNMDAGTVKFSDPDLDGKVTITITLNEGWRFEGVEENVKIQDYEFAPSGNPSPGLFDYKYNATGSPFVTVPPVPNNNYYGVHVNVEWEDCEE
jgi:hypothetical protein